MNVYNIFTALIVILMQLRRTNDRRALAPTLDPPEPDTTYSICYIVIPPSVPLTIDPSPPVLAPPFDPDHAPVPPHTFAGATSAGYGEKNFTTNWTTGILLVVISGLLVQEAVSWFMVYTSDRSFDGSLRTTRDRSRSYLITLSPSPSIPPSLPAWRLTNDPSPECILISPIPAPSAPPSEESDIVVLFSRGTHAAPHSSPLDSPIPSCIPTPSSSVIPHVSPLFSISNLPSSSSLFNKEDDCTETISPLNGDSSTPTGSIAGTASPSVQNFLDEITLALSPSPSSVTENPPPVSRIPTNIIDEPIEAHSNDKTSDCDDHLQPASGTLVDLDGEVTEDRNGDVAKNVVEPAHAPTADAESSAGISASTTQVVEVAESATEPVKPSRPTPPTRTSRLAPTSAWKKSINALISGNERRTTRSAPTRTPSTTPHVVTPAPPPTHTPKKIDWSEHVEQALFTPGNAAAEKTGTTAGMKGREQVSRMQPDRTFDKCNCALESAAFEPQSWNKFKIPASCHPRPTAHFFAPREADKSNPSTRIVVDNVNAFRHHSTEPNVPYANKDIEDLFYPVGAKSVRCFDGRVVERALRYNTSYAVVDFESVEDAEAAFKMFQGRKAYPDSYHLRLKYIDPTDRTFGKRMAVAMGPMERSEEHRKAFGESVEDLDRVDVDLARIVMPSRPGFALPTRPITSSEP